MADLPPDKGEPALMNVINADADTINTFQNGTRFNNLSSFYPGGSLGYLTVLAGTHQYQIKKAGTPNVLLDIPLTLTANRAYSFFIAGNSPDRVFLTNDVFLASNDVEIRFVNASPGLAFDIKIADNFNFSNVAFKAATGFVKMTAGDNNYSVYQAGNPDPIATGKVTLVAGRVYTLFAKGSVTGTGDRAFGLRLLPNR